MSRSLPLCRGGVPEMASNIDLFFHYQQEQADIFPEVLAEIQEYLASKYSTLITVTRGAAPADHRIHRKGISTITAPRGHTMELIDKLYTEMAEFSFFDALSFRKMMWRKLTSLGKM